MLIRSILRYCIKLLLLFGLMSSFSLFADFSQQYLLMSYCLLWMAHCLLCVIFRLIFFFFFMESFHFVSLLFDKIIKLNENVRSIQINRYDDIWCTMSQDHRLFLYRLHHHGKATMQMYSTFRSTFRRW